MPAYRSPEEAEIRDAVVARWRRLRPNGRIIHEINAAGQGSNRIDLMCVDKAEIITCEIKSAKDKLDRLNDQVAAMRRVSHHVIAALHEKFLTPDERRGMEGYLRSPAPLGVTSWIFPEIKRRSVEADIWREPDFCITIPLPNTALDLLWAEELRDLCRATGVSVPPRANMDQSIAALRWGATGAQITKGICAALRARQCIEADPPIEVAA